MVEIIWTPEAAEDFEEIQDYLLREFGEIVLQRFTERVFSFLDLLEDYPHIGTIQQEERKIRSFVISKQTTILYKVESRNIYLLSFFANLDDPQKRG